MNITDIKQEDLGNMFPELTLDEGKQKGNVRFGGDDTLSSIDLFQPVDERKEGVENPDVDVNLTGETTKAPEETKEENKDVEDADITGATKEENQRGRKPKYDFSDISGYFENRIKAGKFVEITEENEKGEKIPFVPKTPEEFDEVIDLQVNYQLEQKAKEIEQNWYKTKSPAWQAVAQYAELTDDPSEILPFLQGVKTINSVEAIDENEIEGAEQIVRTRLAQKGDPEDLIDEQIESLKTTDRLVTTAQKLKPLILKEEKQNLSRMMEQEQYEKQQYQLMVSAVEENVIKALDAPIYGKQKLKNEEKQLVYQLIGRPTQETQGYPIFSAIDKLYDEGDFETLKQVALLVGKKDRLFTYVSSEGSDKTAQDFQRKLRVTVDSRNASANDPEEEEQRRQSVQRNQYSAPRFGRG